MTKEEVLNLMKKRLGKLDEDDKEVAEAVSNFDKTMQKISLLL